MKKALLVALSFTALLTAAGFANAAEVRSVRKAPMTTAKPSLDAATFFAEFDRNKS
jgi:hypothetical protein